MFFIIAGCSETGYQLAKLLQTGRHEVVVLEKSLRRHQLLWEEMGSVVIHGDGANPADLERAGIDRADALVAVTGRDETNLVVCQLAKEKFQVQRTISMVWDDKNQPIFRVLGVDVVVSASDLIMNALEASLAGDNPGFLTHQRLASGELVSLTLPEKAAAVGKSPEELNLPPHSFLSLVIQRKQPKPPQEVASLAAQDELYLFTVQEEKQELYNTLTGA